MIIYQHFTQITYRQKEIRNTHNSLIHCILDIREKLTKKFYLKIQILSLIL